MSDHLIEQPDHFGTPRSVYVHIPFCRHRCGYCSFTLVAGRDYLVEDYLRALEIELASSCESRQEVDTIYLGGGTPSYLSANQLERLLNLLDRWFVLAGDGEFTIEVNPGDLPGEVDSVLRASAINRVSIGIQSFDERKLRSLDRDHSLDQINAVIDAARSLTERISLDLIFAAPADSPERWQRDLQLAIQSPCDHIATYELTIEKGTKFFADQLRQRLCKPNESSCADYYTRAISELSAAGFEHYEVSSFARGNGRSRHNQIYWSGLPYWAFGPGASSFVGGVRRTNHRSVATYLKRVLAGQSPVTESERLSAREMALDRLVFGLRRLDGINCQVFEEQTGFAVESLIGTERWQMLLGKKLLALQADDLKLTPQGLMVSDSICQALLGAS